MTKSETWRVVEVITSANPVDVTRGGWPRSPSDTFRKWIAGVPRIELRIAQDHSVLNHPERGWDEDRLIAWDYKPGSAIPTHVAFDDVENRWRDVSDHHQSDITEAPSDSESVDGLYSKYRVFREPQRDSQGNEVEHPVKLANLHWVADFTNAQGERVLLWDELEEVDSFIFVLKPDTDYHARVALAAYAYSVKNDKPALFDDLMDVLSDFEDL